MFCEPLSRAPMLRRSRELSIRPFRCTRGRAAGCRASRSAAAHPIGTGGGSPEPETQIQNRFSEGDDLAWTQGAHSLRFGASIDRVQSHVLWPFQGESVWTFPNVAMFLAGTATTVSGVPNAPTNNPIRDFRELDFRVLRSGRLEGEFQAHPEPRTAVSAHVQSHRDSQ